MPIAETNEFHEELRAALKAAEEAGEIMDKFRGRSNQIQGREKEGLNDLVTDADLECQEKIVEVIETVFPEDGFKGEEDNLESKDDADRVWVIDPIDGTTNFSSGWTYFGTSIALKIDGEYKVGVVHSPDTGLGKTWCAIKDSGSYLLPDAQLKKGRRLKVSKRENIEKGYFTCFQSPDNDKRREIEQHLVAKLTSRDMNYRECASGALMLPEIAEGGLDARFDIVDEWDYAAASLILEEAGGEFEKLGRLFGKDVVISTNSTIHQKFKSEVEDTLDCKEVEI